MLRLIRHRDTPELCLDGIDVTLGRGGDRWHFTFALQNSDALVTPPKAIPSRADHLWETTCFEVFVGVRNTSYLEFNFSPSGRWAAYRFDAPRAAMRDEQAVVGIRVDEGNGWFSLRASVGCDALVGGAPLGLSAVIEEDGGVKSYWALAHPDGPPDFHDPTCFIARLPE